MDFLNSYENIYSQNDGNFSIIVSTILGELNTCYIVLNNKRNLPLLPHALLIAMLYIKWEKKYDNGCFKGTSFDSPFIAIHAIKHALLCCKIGLKNNIGSNEIILFKKYWEKIIVIAKKLVFFMYIDDGSA